MDQIIHEIDLSTLPPLSGEGKRLACSFHGIAVSYYKEDPNYFSIRTLHFTLRGKKSRPVIDNFFGMDEYKPLFKEHEITRENSMKTIYYEEMFSTKLLWLAIRWQDQYLFCKKMCEVFGGFDLCKDTISTRFERNRGVLQSVLFYDICTSRDAETMYLASLEAQDSLLGEYDIEIKKGSGSRKSIPEKPDFIKTFDRFVAECSFVNDPDESENEKERFINNKRKLSIQIGKGGPPTTFVHPNLLLLILDWNARSMCFWERFLNFHKRTQKKSEDPLLFIDMNLTWTKDINNIVANAMLDDIEVKYHKRTSYIHARSLAKIVKPGSESNIARWLKNVKTKDYIDTLNEELKDVIAKRKMSYKGIDLSRGGNCKNAIESEDEGGHVKSDAASLPRGNEASEPKLPITEEPEILLENEDKVLTKETSEIVIESEDEGGRVTFDAPPEMIVNPNEIIAHSSLVDIHGEKTLDAIIDEQLEMSPSLFEIPKENEINDSLQGLYIHPVLAIHLIMSLNNRRAISYLKAIVVLSLKAAADGKTVETVTKEEYDKLKEKCAKLELENAKLKHEIQFNYIIETGSIVVSFVDDKIHMRSSVINEPEKKNRLVFHDVHRPKCVMAMAETKLKEHFEQVRKNVYLCTFDEKDKEIITEIMNETIAHVPNETFVFNEEEYKQRLERFQTTGTESARGFLYESECSREFHAKLYKDMSEDWIDELRLSRADPGIDLVDAENKIVYQCKWYKLLKRTHALERSLAFANKIKLLDNEYQIKLIVPDNCYVHKAVREIFDAVETFGHK